MRLRAVLLARRRTPPQPAGTARSPRWTLILRHMVEESLTGLQGLLADVERHHDELQAWEMDDRTWMHMHQLPDDMLKHLVRILPFQDGTLHIQSLKDSERIYAEKYMHRSRSCDGRSFGFHGCGFWRPCQPNLVAFLS